MSDDGAEKSFEPTQTRLAKAKAEGDSPRSSELSGAFSFAAGLAGLLVAIPFLALHARRAFSAIAAAPLGFDTFNGTLAMLPLWAVVPAACAAFAGASCSLLQNGGLHPVAISIRFDRLSPGEGFRRLVSREAALGAARALVAVICIAFALLPSLIQLLAAGSGLRNVQSLAELAYQSAFRCAFVIAGLGMIFGVADFALIFAKWRKKLRMTFEEVKRDRKEQDGDPGAKARRRSMHRDISQTSLQRLKEAAFVLTNPTHIAIALEYRPPAIPVPRVLLKAADQSALRVRQVALDFQIPIIENVALARSLFATAKPGESIPKETYIAVAEIVASLDKAGVLS